MQLTGARQHGNGIKEEAQQTHSVEVRKAVTTNFAWPNQNSRDLLTLTEHNYEYSYSVSFEWDWHDP